MPPAPPLPLAPTHGIAALIGGMLEALLYALLGWQLRARVREARLEGTMAPVLMAEAAISLELEPIIEWEWVPAPWRAGPHSRR